MAATTMILLSEDKYQRLLKSLEDRVNQIEISQKNSKSETRAKKRKIESTPPPPGKPQSRKKVI